MWVVTTPIPKVPTYRLDDPADCRSVPVLTIAAKKWADRYRADGEKAVIDRPPKPSAYSPVLTLVMTERRIVDLRFTSCWDSAPWPVCAWLTAAWSGSMTV